MESKGIVIKRDSFFSTSQGLSVTGSTKGYAFLTDPPKLVVQSLDTYWSDDKRSFTAFRHIDGNWYLILITKTSRFRLL